MMILDMQYIGRVPSPLVVYLWFGTWSWPELPKPDLAASAEIRV